MYSSAPIDQPMAQPIYTPDEIGFDAPSKREALSMPPLVRNESHYDMVDRSTGCMSPSTELDGKNRHSTRRRIQVACNRCRKRKIKCSGDPGDGQGCSNCRTAGFASCQFLRVNSSIMQTKVGGWACPSATATMSSHRPGLYVPSMTPKVGGASMTAPPTSRMVSFTRTANYAGGIESAHSPSTYHRFPLSIDPPVHYEDDASAYAVPSSAYTMPGFAPNVFMDFYPWNPKAWHSVPVGRTPTGPVFSDSDAEAALGPPGVFNPTQSTEGPPIVPTMGFSAAEGQGENRTLSNLGRNQAQMGLGAFTTPEAALSGLPHDGRMGSWTPKGAFLNHGNMPNPHGGCRSGLLNRSKPTAESLYGLLPSSGPSSPLVPTTMDAIDAGDGQPSRTFSHSHLPDYGSDTYVYSSSERRDKGHSKADGLEPLLMNGLTYSRPHFLAPHSSPPLVPTSAFRSTTDMHHAAIPSLGSSEY
ncbi:uncharacterized protein BO80DRAFT_347438 [Aspergillus ibericus CBS 121593]|uniref:Zn(2)-C6 fungal-type domain-containing protein n=1 Tax=Aspergillus ibericus CBS 121593 TaxID=1448316 RepID=A0A395H9P2_9EURO|nr:hypothetical protein BO80DRAFT_347438 [Aspergillus ibericus CBS 121593]RAL04346.1 hypothetical protein BO80DRAFT_347438 [Aspergillus ibericus CBS 121593]